MQETNGVLDKGDGLLPQLLSIADLDCYYRRSGLLDHLFGNLQC